MKKILIYLMAIAMIVMPMSIFAEDGYKDLVAEIAQNEPAENVVRIYQFKGDGCPHCEAESLWIDVMKDTYGDKIDVVKYEIWQDQSNRKLNDEVRKYFELEPDDGVPFTVIGNEYFMGFAETDTLSMENVIRKYLGLEELNEATYKPEENNIAEVNENNQEIIPEVVTENINSKNELINLEDKALRFLLVSGGLACLGIFMREVICSYITIKETTHRCDCEDCHCDDKECDCKHKR